MQVKDFGSTLFGVVVIFVFLPLFSVYSAKYSFIKPGLAKVLACFLMSMLLGGILCVKTAFGKKLGLVAQFCLTKDGTASLRCLMMAMLATVLVFSIAPAAIFIVWLAAVAVILLVAKIIGPPCYSYEELRSMGFSDYEAKKLLQQTVSV